MVRRSLAQCGPGLRAAAGLLLTHHGRPLPARHRLPARPGPLSPVLRRRPAHLFAPGRTRLAAQGAPLRRPPLLRALSRTLDFPWHEFLPDAVRAAPGSPLPVLFHSGTAAVRPRPPAIKLKSGTEDDW